MSRKQRLNTINTVWYLITFIVIVIIIEFQIVPKPKQIGVSDNKLSSYHNNLTNVTDGNDTNHTVSMNLLKKRKYENYDMIILFWTTAFGQKPSESWITGITGFGSHRCDMSSAHKVNQKILVTDNRSLRTVADALIFHGPDINRRTFAELNKEYDDIYIVYSMESTFNRRETETFRSHFNLLMSYRFDADIPIPYVHPNDLKKWFDAKNIHSFKERNNMSVEVLWIAQNCNAGNGRTNYLRELFKYIPYHSLGTCLHFNPMNIRIPSRKEYEKDISDVISRYKFYIAFENSNCGGYVTEKLLKALQGTTIPIVFSVNGIPEYHKLLPPHSYINAGDFESAKKLAEYLKLVGSNETLYSSFFHFKSTESIKRKEWNKLMQTYPFRKQELMKNNDPWCNAANIIYKYHETGQYNKTFPADNSCLATNFMAKYV